jgi:glucose-6-phosphate-specific signal transduction histidine kinase
MKPSANRTALAVLLFPVCLTLIIAVHWLTTKFFFWLAPSGKSFIQRLFSDSSVGLAVSGVAGLVSWFVQRYYVQFTSRRASSTLLITYALVSIAAFGLFIWTQSYYSAFGTTLINAGQLIGLAIGREHDEQPALA